MKVAIDMGGVISKYPRFFRSLFAALRGGPIEVYVLSDMKDRAKLLWCLRENGFGEDLVPDSRVLQASYDEHGELCKKVVCERLGIEMLMDDHAGYVCAGSFLRLLVMPDPELDYYSEDWKAPPGDTFGRRAKKTIETNA